jgi:hypothetical protein
MFFCAVLPINKNNTTASYTFHLVGIPMARTFTSTVANPLVLNLTRNEALVLET